METKQSGSGHGISWSIEETARDDSKKLLIKKEKEFPGVIKKVNVEFPGVLVFAEIV